MKSFYKKTEATLVKRPKYTKQQEIDYLNRLIKRANKAAGYSVNKKPFKWEWTLDGKTFQKLTAFTKSDAKSLIKKELGLKKKPLPKELVLTRGDRVE